MPRGTANVRTGVGALSFMFASCFALLVSPAGAQDLRPDPARELAISKTIGRASDESSALQTYLGLANLAATKREPVIGGISRREALRHAKRSAQRLERSLGILAAMRADATVEQERAIDGLEMLAHTRIQGIDAVLAIVEDDGVDAAVTSCTGWWECWGFGTACEAAGGKHEEWGAGVETCTK